MDNRQKYLIQIFGLCCINYSAIANNNTQTFNTTTFNTTTSNTRTTNTKTINTQSDTTYIPDTSANTGTTVPVTNNSAPVTQPATTESEQRKNTVKESMLPDTVKAPESITQMDKTVESY